jgi:DNA-directed RNA polymerase subunit RPC12/RpoP
MANLACRICGRVVYTAASLDSLFAEERRCPRCGGMLFVERRVDSRRKHERRHNPADRPGPPGGSERRIGERRRARRRRDDAAGI